jgi:pimeloyl-ACP methyl ester carboxylesterase
MFVIWILLALLVILLVVALVFSETVLHSRRQPIVRNPKEYGMDYRDVSFKSTDGLTLKGWWIPSSGKEVTILTHPLPFNRHGFVAKNQGFPPLDFTDVDLLTTVKALHEAGYSVLTFDLRNNGESDAGITGVGQTEYQDVLGAVDFVRQSVPGARIGIVSFCMGANSTMVALSKGKDRIGPIEFLVAIQPVSAKVFIRSYLRAVYTPLSLVLLPILDAIVQLRGGFALDKMSPLAAARDITIPTFYIQAREDPWTELSDTQAFYDATPGPKELWLVDGVKKRFEMYNYIGQHPERVLAFTREHFGR